MWSLHVLEHFRLYGQYQNKSMTDHMRYTQYLQYSFDTPHLPQISFKIMILMDNPSSK